jgi:Fungal specific transcription factor domain
LHDPGLADTTTGNDSYAIHDLALLHYFTTVSFAKLDTIASQRLIWRDTIVQLGFREPFLLHGILAIAAIHQAQDIGSDDGELRRIATQHQNVGLAEYRSALSNLNSSNVCALFAFACLTVLHTFAIADIATAGGALQEMIHCICLVRGIRTVISPHFEALAQTELGPLLQNGRRSAKGAGGEVPDILKLCSLVNNEGRPEHKQALLDAIEHCHTAFLGAVCSDEERSALAQIFTWPVLLSADFISLLKAEDDLALIILSHYSVLFYLKRDCWWLRGWYDSLLRDIEARVMPEFQHWLDWPKEIKHRRFLQI